MNLEKNHAIPANNEVNLYTKWGHSEGKNARRGQIFVVERSWNRVAMQKVQTVAG